MLIDQDVEANQRELTGKITILLVSPRGGGDVGFVECAHVGRVAVLVQSVEAAYDALLHVGLRFGRKTVLIPAANAPELLLLQLNVRPIQSPAEAVDIMLVG